MVHLRNDVLSLQHKDRLNSLLITGCGLPTDATKDKVSEAVTDVLKTVLKIKNDELDHIPKPNDIILMKWGIGASAIKCKFDSSALVGKLIKNSFELKNTPVRIQPDLSPEQRKVKQELWRLGQSLQKSGGKMPQLRSCRYLIMKGKNDAENTFYESDGTCNVYTKPEWVIPSLALAAPVTSTSQCYNVQSSQQSQQMQVFWQRGASQTGQTHKKNPKLRTAPVHS
ncbi:unnamed protein product [Allacma fusca]|uniref:Uncharacterized protein n=1 Tax=Allacma fusca TaxID=39272 RepID=A0A8J2PCJ3_9HEXA|nr:unnamed protein product [Allacma fusca]